METRLKLELSWQLTAVVELPQVAELPMTVTSVQVKPTTALTSWTTIPRSAKMAVAAGSLAVVMVLQQTSPGEEGGGLLLRLRAVTGTQPMEMRLAISIVSFRRMCGNERLAMRVILASNLSRGAAASSRVADDGDVRAGQTNDCVDVVDDNAK
jgi:hypothetical protein